MNRLAWMLNTRNISVIFMIEYLVCQTLTRRIKVDFGNCIIFNIQSIIYKVTRYNNIITNTMDYKYLNIINIAYFCALINQNNLPNRLALCPYTENLSIIK